MKIFWSWQSDTPGKTGRHFIRDCLEAAVFDLKQIKDIEEPREREVKDALHIDHDRQGISGSPDLAALILEKIAASKVVVADITPVSTIPAREQQEELIPEKRNMNPNVAIELGYALHALSDRNILLVLNTFYGGREFLPFDLRHKAGPLTFRLAPDASKETLQAAASRLKGDLINALRPFLQTPGQAVSQASFQAVPTTLSAASYFEAGESLATFGREEHHDRVDFSYPDGRGFYLRLMPLDVVHTSFHREDLLGFMRMVGLPALHPRASGLFCMNDFGAISVEPLSHARSGPLEASTQVFSSGEIWGVAQWPLSIGSYGKLVLCKSLESTFRERLALYVRFLKDSLRFQPPYTIIAGAVGLKNYKIAISDDPHEAVRIFEDAFEVRQVVSDVSQLTLDRFVHLMSKALFKISERNRPIGLFGFEPS